MTYQLHMGLALLDRRDDVILDHGDNMVLDRRGDVFLDYWDNMVLGHWT